LTLAFIFEVNDSDELLDDSVETRHGTSLSENC